MKENRMIMPEDFIVAGVSGGADSVCLLFVLLALQKEIPFSLAVVHVNHGIRQESGADAIFVRELCREQGIPFHLFTTDIRALAKEKKISEEEAGREYRYQCFRQILWAADNAKTSSLNGVLSREKLTSKKEAVVWIPGQSKDSGKKIAVAHHQDDRAETMLFNLFRGSGLSGLVSIRPVREDIIRPLLVVSRKEIEAFLAEQNLSFRTDHTNQEDIYARNRIRHHILPQAEEINEKAVKHMADTADYLWEAEHYLRKQTESLMADCTVRTAEQIEIDLKKLRQQDVLLQKRVFMEALDALSPGRKDITAAHIAALLRLAKSGGSKAINLPYHLIGSKIYDTIVIKYATPETTKETLKEIPIKISKEISKEIPEGIPKKTSKKISKETYKETYDKNKAARQTVFPLIRASGLRLPNMGTLKISTFSHQKSKKIPQKAYTKWLDYDRISSYAVFRTRQPGDYLIINSAGNRKTLKEYMINEKIPRAERETRYLLADASHVIWLPGHRISEYYKVTDETKVILQIEILIDQASANIRGDRQNE